MNARLAALSLALLAGPALAQELTTDVVRNPDDTVTYTIDLDGPPKGTAFVLVGTMQTLLPSPILLPPLIGELYLDPLYALNVGAITCDPAGQGQLQMTYPSSVSDGFPIYFQSLVIDAQLNLALTNLALSYQSGASTPAASVSSFALSHESMATIDATVHALPGTRLLVEHYAPNYDWLKGANEFLVGPTGALDLSVGLNTPVQFCDTTLVFEWKQGQWAPPPHLPCHQE